MVHQTLQNLAIFSLALLVTGAVAAADTSPAAPLSGLSSSEYPFTPLPPQAAVAEGKVERGARSEVRAAFIRSHYTKYEFRIPMRDGIKLFTAVYVPNDASSMQRYPFLLYRTPYSVAPYGIARYKHELGPFESYEHEGFIFVFQDVRGTYLSDGPFDNMRPERSAGRGPRGISESTDTYDTIEWLLHNVSYSNGCVGMWGISYPGFYAAAGAIDSHPALKAVSPQAPIADWFLGDDFHRHGAFNLEMAFGFFSKFGVPRPVPTDDENWEPFDFGTFDVYRYFLNLGPLSNAPARFAERIPFWEDFVAHPNYDEFWQSRNLVPNLRGIRAAMLVVGGWYDTEDLYGPLHVSAAISAQNPGVKNSLIIGPWIHGGWSRTDGSGLGDTDFGWKTSEAYAVRELAFFKHHLKGVPAPDPPAAWVFETGANRWRTFSAWPPNLAKRQAIYLRAGGRLDFQPPTAGSDANPGYDEYLSDPGKPVPCASDFVLGCVRRFAAEDQRFAAVRPDVLSYATDPLSQDLTLAGPIEVDLQVSTTGTDADFVVKVIDVSPDRPPGPKHAKSEDKASEPERGGQETLVRGEPFRARFRDSYTTPRPLIPNQVTRIHFTLNDIFHTFLRKHRLMVQIQSSWFPFIDRNPQTYVPNIFLAKPTDFIKAIQRIYSSPSHPSVLTVRVLPAVEDRT
jgi:putative CocE/NonD family hydrolase